MLYSNGAAVCCIVIEQRCVIYLWSTSVLYSNPVAACYILMEHQCVIL